MSLSEELSLLGEATPSALEHFATLLDPPWVDEALAAPGAASIRYRRVRSLARGNAWGLHRWPGCLSEKPAQPRVL